MLTKPLPASPSNVYLIGKERWRSIVECKHSSSLSTVCPCRRTGPRRGDIHRFSARLAAGKVRSLLPRLALLRGETSAHRYQVADFPAATKIPDVRSSFRICKGRKEQKLSHRSERCS